MAEKPILRKNRNSAPSQKENLTPQNQAIQNLKAKGYTYYGESKGNPLYTLGGVKRMTAVEPKLDEHGNFTVFEVNPNRIVTQNLPLSEDSPKFIQVLEVLPDGSINSTSVRSRE
jgi:hypothetical protein